MDFQEAIVVSFCALMVVLVFASNQYVMVLNDQSKYFLGIDAVNHITTITNKTQNYQPLSIAVLSLLINPNRPEFFYFIHVFLLFVVIPLLLFRVSKHFFAPIVYFSSYFVWLSDNNATLPQTIVVVFLLAMFLVKNNYLRLVIVFLSFGVHFYAWVFLLGWFFILNFKEVSNRFWFLIPCATPKTALSFVKPELKEKVAIPLVQATNANVLNLLTRIAFLPLWIFMLQGLWAKENREWLILGIFILGAGIFSGIGGNLRILSLFVFPFAIGVTHSFKNSNPFLQKMIIFFVVIQFVGNFVSWVERKNILFCDLIVNNYGGFADKTFGG